MIGVPGLEVCAETLLFPTNNNAKRETLKRKLFIWWRNLLSNPNNIFVKT